MSMYKISELKAFLEELNIDAKKGLSQNFLIDGNILDKIIRAAHIEPHDKVIEVGPGPGALTERLLKGGAQVTAIEIDPILSKALNRLQTQDNQLNVIDQDFLKFPLEEFLGQNQSGSKYKVVTNTPYHITTPILTKLLPLYPFISSVTLMVQKEFAKRLVSSPKTPDYSHLTLFVQFYSTATYCFTVEPTCFYPRPRVQSAVVHLELKPPTPVSSPDRFFEMTREAFQHRRKMLRASLKELYAPKSIETCLNALGLLPSARPEELSLNQLIDLFEKLQKA